MGVGGRRLLDNRRGFTLAPIIAIMTNVAEAPKTHLTEPLLSTVRQLYGEAQQWTRHYEQLIVNANTLIISAAAIFVGQSLGEHLSAMQSRLVLLVPLAIALVGVVLTQTLFRLYAQCIERLIRYEGLLGCFDVQLGQSLDGQGSLIASSLQQKPVRRPTSVKFFLWLHGLLALSYLVLMWFRQL